jgi:hypothetical protein
MHRVVGSYTNAVFPVRREYHGRQYHWCEGTDIHSSTV